MPTTYAHWLFGDKCLKKLPENQQLLINKYRDVFDYGVHGPDVLFYYNALSKNRVMEYGNWMHDTAFSVHLKMFKKNYLKHDNKDAALVYLLGFLSHFTLDTYCHTYINNKIEVDGVSHFKTESQYDRHLLIKNGLDPIKTKVTFSLKPSKMLGHYLGQLYDDFDDEIMYKACKDQLFYLNLLKDSSNLKRKILRLAFNIVHANDFNDLLITETSEDYCKNSNLRLDKYMEVAANHYPKLAKELIEYLDNDKKLSKYFDHNFNYKDKKDFPVLKYEEELKYKVNFQK